MCVCVWLCNFPLIYYWYFDKILEKNNRRKLFVSSITFHSSSGGSSISLPFCFNNQFLLFLFLFIFYFRISSQNRYFLIIIIFCFYVSSFNIGFHWSCIIYIFIYICLKIILTFDAHCQCYRKATRRQNINKITCKFIHIYLLRCEK